jgi:uncharacterized protein (UPF0548 family)
MYFLKRPNTEFIQAFLADQRNCSFSYSQVGASRQSAPKGYTVDHNRLLLGNGPECFERAAQAIRQWKMFDMPWVNLCWPDTPIQEGVTVAVLISHFGFWSLNACRIVYLIEEHGATERFGFAYGTLMEHGEQGEERFSVEYHTNDGSVWYDLYAISRPNLLARLGYPLARSLQKRFARESKIAMQTAASAPDELQERCGSN